MIRAALEPAPIDDGITVAEAARVLGCDETTVRELVHHRQLEGWRIGKGNGKKLRAIRVSRSSCLEYRERNRIGDIPAEAPPPRPAKPRRPSAAHQEALAYLRSIGVRV